MKVGTLCYATDQGIGIMAKQFYDAGVVTDALVVRHGKRVTHDHWYENSWQITDLRSREQIEAAKVWCSFLDVLLCFETPFVWELLPYCKEKGIKTVLVPMHECSLEHPPYEFDQYLCPSLLEMRCFPDRSHLVQIPVYPETWKLRTKAEVFVHNAGHGGLKGRNGTKELIGALRYIKSPIELLIRSQEKEQLMIQQISDALPQSSNMNIYWEFGTVPHTDLFSKGDVFVFPEKFQGQSYPLEEARATGMLVMCGDRFPMNTWLPKICDYGSHYDPDSTGLCAKCGFDPSYDSPLIPVHSYNHNQRIGPPYQPFDEAVFRPEDIAAKIDEWYGRDITEYSKSGLEWARANSWDVRKPKYMELLK